VRKNKHKKIGKVSCRTNCKDWKEVQRKNGMITVCVGLQEKIYQNKEDIMYHIGVLKLWIIMKRKRGKRNEKR